MLQPGQARSLLQNNQTLIGHQRVEASYGIDPSRSQPIVAERIYNVLPNVSASALNVPQNIANGYSQYPLNLRPSIQMVPNSANQNITKNVTTRFGSTIRGNINNLIPTPQNISPSRVERIDYTTPDSNNINPALINKNSSIINEKQSKQQKIVRNLLAIFGKQSSTDLLKPIQAVFQQLELKYNDMGTKDNLELANILFLILKYPNQKLSDTHKNANRLGELDLSQREYNKMVQSKKIQKQYKPGLNTCECCDLKQQKSYISWMTHLKDVKNIGISTHLYFTTVQNLLILLFLIFLLFSCFAIVTNVISSHLYKLSFVQKQPEPALKSYLGFLAASIGSKQLSGNNNFNTTTLTIQAWLGFLCVIAWMFVFIYIKVKQKIQQSQIDYEQITIADYTLVFEKMPIDIPKTYLDNQLKKYQKKVLHKYPEIFSEFQEQINIQKINPTAPFYLGDQIYDVEEINNINNKYNKFKQQFRAWIKHRKSSPLFSQSKEAMQKTQAQFYKIQKQRQLIYKQYGQGFILKKKQQCKNKKQLDLFVTFKSTSNKLLLEKLHQKQKSLIFNSPCLKNNEYFSFEYNNKQIKPIIRPAPEPQDINWVSLSRTPIEVVTLNIFSFLITVVILSLSFFIILLLSKIQIDYRIYSMNHQNFGSFLVSKLISFGISMVIVVVNILISIILNYLTKMERNESYTHQQSSIGFKLVFALLVNVILIPVVVNFFIKGNIYGVDGLADDVFTLAVSNAIVTPFINLINIGYQFKKIVYWFKRKPDRKLNLNQKQLNILNQNVQFEVGASYANAITLYLFTCFFCTLQPLIVLISSVGLFLTYFVSKYNLFKRCKRPKPGNNTINYRMYQMIVFGPLFFTLGNIFWMNLSGKLQTTIPNTISLAVSIIICVFPFQILGKILSKNQIKVRKQLYEKDKQIFPSQYDKLNPLTARQVKAAESKARKQREQEMKKNPQFRIVQAQKKQTQIKKPSNKSSKIGGLYVNNSSDKLSIAELFEDIDNVMEQDEEECKYPIKIQHNFSFKPADQADKQTLNNNTEVVLPNMANHLTSRYINPSQVTSYGVYIFQSNHQSNRNSMKP